MVSQEAGRGRESVGYADRDMVIARFFVCV